MRLGTRMGLRRDWDRDRGRDRCFVLEFRNKSHKYLEDVIMNDCFFGVDFREVNLRAPFVD